jgi:hypothetical protein
MDSLPNSHHCVAESCDFRLTVEVKGQFADVFDYCDGFCAPPVSPLSLRSHVFQQNCHCWNTGQALIFLAVFAIAGADG